MTKMVCTQEDDFTFEKPRWLAHLSNGEIVIQDDGRPGAEPPQAWLRLKEYCCQNNLKINNLTLQFRSNHVAPLPANAESYYFINMIAAVDYGKINLHFFIIGYKDGENVHVQFWKTPELFFVGQETRSAIADGVREYLI